MANPKKKKSKWKKIAKNVGKAAVLAGALYGASKLGKKGNVSKTAAGENLNIGSTGPQIPDIHSGLKSNRWKFDTDHLTGPTLAAKGGRIGAKGGKVQSDRIGKKGGGRTGKQFGGGLGSTARRDMRSGYYPSDMGMRGGTMYKKGGRVKSMGVAKRGGGVAKK